MQELEDLNFLLKSGIVLCKLVLKIVPGTEIDVDKVEVMFFSFSSSYCFPFLSGWKLECQTEEHFSLLASCCNLRSSRKLTFQT
jgi:hypothetical protein